MKGTQGNALPELRQWHYLMDQTASRWGCGVKRAIALHPSAVVSKGDSPFDGFAGLGPFRVHDDGCVRLVSCHSENSACPYYANAGSKPWNCAACRREPYGCSRLRDPSGPLPQPEPRHARRRTDPRVSVFLSVPHFHLVFTLLAAHGLRRCRTRAWYSIPIGARRLRFSP